VCELFVNKNLLVTPGGFCIIWLEVTKDTAMFYREQKQWWNRVCSLCELRINLEKHDHKIVNGQHYHTVCWDRYLQESEDREYPNEIEPHG
jgi:hypothetical protein